MIYKGMKDKETREAIISKKGLEENIFLSAGAGSGKTTSLVNRVMALLETGAPISSIVAITFTREAGKLFYSRISEELQKRILEKDDHEALYKSALDDLDNAFFGTIDSFTNRLLLEHSQEAGVPLDFSPIEGSLIVKEVIDEILKDLANEPTTSMFLQKYEKLKDFDLGPDDIRGILLKVATEDTFTIKLPLWADPTYSNIELETLDKIFEVGLKLKGIFENLILKGRTDAEVKTIITGKRLEEYNRVLFNFDKEHKINRIELFKVIMDIFKYCISKGKIIIDEDLLEEADKLLKDPVVNKITDHYREGKYHYSLSFAIDCIYRLNERCLLQGKISYQKALSLLIDMLERDIKNGGTILDYIKKKYRYFLVDELQDNNYIQSKLFNILSADRQGSLFLVGDEMQAIYRFRGGDVENFKILRKKMEEDKKSGAYILSKNFRSSKPLCDYFNDVFSKERFFKSEYRMIEPSSKQDVFDIVKNDVIDGVYKFKVGARLNRDNKRGYDQVPSTEVINVVMIVNALIGQEIFTYNHKEQKVSKRPIEFEDIMIITKEKKKLEDYIEEFKFYDIPYNVAGRSALSESSGVLVIKNFLDYLLEPYEDFYKAKLLMTEPFSVSEEEYYRYINGEEVEYISSIMEKVNELQGEILNKTPSYIVKAIINKLSLSLMITLADMEAGNESVYHLLELVRDKEEKGELLNLKDLKNFVEDLMTLKDQEYELSIEGGPKGVRLMNLHKTKGLEAPVVILADCERKDKDKDPEKFYDYENREVKWFEIKGGTYNQTKLISTELFLNELIKEKGFLEEEKQRLKYVAATRAGNVLIIPELYKTERSEDGYPRITNERVISPWDDLLTEEVCDLPVFLNKEETEEALEVSEENYESLKNFVKPSLKRDETLKRIRPSMVEFKEEEKTSLTFTKMDLVNEDEELVRFREERSLYGTMVHLLMEEAVNFIRRGKELSDKRIKEIGETGKPESEEALKKYVEMLTKVHETFKEDGYDQDWDLEGQRHEVNLFEKLKSVDEVYTELPFTLFIKTNDPLFKDLVKLFDLEEHKDLYINGIIDLLYKEGDKYVVVDYKTDSSTLNMYKRHEPQLELYKKILKRMLNLERLPEAYLYHIPLEIELEKEDEELPF